MSWVDRVAPYKIGDIVQYSAAWLRNTGQYTGDVPRAKGKIVGIERTPSYTIAEIEWDLPDIPTRVNVANLEKVRGLSR